MMNERKLLTFACCLMAAAVLAWSYGPALAAEVPAKGQATVTRDQVLKKMGKMTQADQAAAAKSLQQKGLLPGKAALTVPGAATKLQPTQEGAALLDPQAMLLAPLPGIEGPGGVPHYFGPYGNWAFSPLPRGAIQEIRIDNPGSGYTSSPVVTILDAYGTGTGATASATVANGEITAITVNNAGSGYSAPVVSITGGAGVDGAASAYLNPATVTGGLRKFVDKLPLLGPTGANNLGQYIPVGVADKTSYPGSDYYEIALVEYTEQMHSDLPPTRLQGYVQLNSPGAPGNVALIDPDGFPITLPNGQPALGVTKPHYLGPLLVANGRAHGVLGDAGKPVPVRVKFYNLLPTNERGDLFLPVDESIMGAGYGPAVGGNFGKYSQNRATIHLHGNNTVWISDGNVHQWITPATENTHYPKGVSVRNVPDMKDASGNVVCDGDKSGCMTFFYTNAQSARLDVLPRPCHGHHAPERVRRPGRGLPDHGPGREGHDRWDQRIRRQPGQLEGPARPRHPADHPGQDLCRQGHRLRAGSYLERDRPARRVRKHHRGGHRRPLVPPRLHVGPEPFGPHRNERLRALALRTLVQPAYSRVRQRAAHGVHRGRAGAQ